MMLDLMSSIAKMDTDYYMTIIESFTLESTKWVVSIADINQVQAERILKDLNKSNRRIRNDHVNSLTRIFNQNEFVLTPEPLIFDTENNVMSAQHRLSALVKSGKNAKFMVVRNVSREIYKVIDQGARRSMADAFNTDPRVQQTINQLARYRFVQTPTPGDVERVLNVFGAHTIRLVHECPSSVRTLSAAPVKAAAVIRMSISDPDFVVNAYKTLVTQDYDSMSAYMKSFSQQIARGDVTTYKPTDLFIRAWLVFDKNNENKPKLLVRTTNAMDEVNEYLNLLVP